MTKTNTSTTWPQFYGDINKQIAEPSLTDNLLKLELQILSNFNCHRIGVINSFDPTTITASVKLVDKRLTVTGDVKDYTLLENCPVMINCNSVGGITRPINVGDNCLVSFNDRDIDNWYSTGLSQLMNTARMHDFSDGIVTVGLFNLNNLPSSYNNTATEIKYNSSIISLQDKILFQNGSQNLKSILDSLITCIKNLQVVDPISGNLSITPATTSALSTIATNLDALLM